MFLSSVSVSVYSESHDTARSVDSVGKQQQMKRRRKKRERTRRARHSQSDDEDSERPLLLIDPLLVKTPEAQHPFHLEALAEVGDEEEQDGEEGRGGGGSARQTAVNELAKETVLLHRSIGGSRLDRSGHDLPRKSNIEKEELVERRRIADIARSQSVPVEAMMRGSIKAMATRRSQKGGESAKRSLNEKLSRLSLEGEERVEEEGQRTQKAAFLPEIGSRFSKKRREAEEKVASPSSSIASPSPVLRSASTLPFIGGGVKASPSPSFVSRYRQKDIQSRLKTSEDLLTRLPAITFDSRERQWLRKRQTKTDLAKVMRGEGDVEPSKTECLREEGDFAFRMNSITKEIRYQSEKELEEALSLLKETRERQRREVEEGRQKIRREDGLLFPLKAHRKAVDILKEEGEPTTRRGLK